MAICTTRFDSIQFTAIGLHGNLGPLQGDSTTCEKVSKEVTLIMVEGQTRVEQAFHMVHDLGSKHYNRTAFFANLKRFPPNVMSYDYYYAFALHMPDSKTILSCLRGLPGYNFVLF